MRRADERNGTVDQEVSSQGPALEERLELPVIAAPMFLASGPELVVAACKSGVLGTFPALNPRSSESLSFWMEEIKSSIAEVPNAAPWGVNLIVRRSNPRLDADLQEIVRHKVPVVITSLGIERDVVDAVQSYGGLVFHDVVNVRHAEKAAAAEVDGIVAVASGAGGHGGSLSPFALVPEIRRFFGGIVALGGAMTTGAHIAAARMLGADLAYIGTRFLTTREARVSDRHKAMILAGRSSDILYTPSVSGVGANFLTESIRELGLDPADPIFKVPGKIKVDHPRLRPWIDFLSAGQGVGSIDDIPTVAELCERLRVEYRLAMSSTSSDQYCQKERRTLEHRVGAD